jgi:NADPH:quinone reductase-like Zn-dependent oxidoreductase
MKAVRSYSHVRPDAFVYEEVPLPQPGAGEVQVRVHAVAVTPSEFEWLPTSKLRDGEPRPLPIILGHEFSGVVSALEAGVGDLREGDAVYGINDWYRDGAQAEYCVARAVEVGPKPRSVDHVVAAATPISALTAWQGLIDRAHVAAGQTVLVHGAAGAVGLFAVQLAHRLGARVVGTCSTANVEFTRDLGADEVIDYRTQRFEDRVRNVDVVFDTVGGETFERSWEVLKPGGRMVTIAAAGEFTASQRVRDAFFIVEPKRDQLAEVARLIDAGELRSPVGAVFPLAEAARAYAHKGGRGKAVLRVVDESGTG